MDLETIKKKLSQRSPKDLEYLAKVTTAERYFHKKNDIYLNEQFQREVLKNKEAGREVGLGEDVLNLKRSHYAIASNFYFILVSQKVSYLFTHTPVFDVGDDDVNSTISDILGERFSDVCAQLCENAANGIRSWLHVWIEDGTFQYGVVDSKQILPDWNSKINRDLISVMREYTDVDENGEEFITVEYWDENDTCFSYKMPGSRNVGALQEYCFNSWSYAKDHPVGEPTNVYDSPFDEISWIPFYNNRLGETDLNSVKSLIDTYDRTYSGYVNDLEDMTQYALILEGYGGEDLDQFKEELNKYRIIKLDSDAEGKGDVRPLALDIQGDVKEKLLELTRKRIFEDGQGLDYQDQDFGNVSGVALEHKYAPLELKCAATEAGFRPGFEKLVRMICKFIGYEPEYIHQSWKRNRIYDQTNPVQMAKDLDGILSLRSRLALLPVVTDPDAELELLQQEKEEAQANSGGYPSQWGMLAQQDQDQEEDTDTAEGE